MAKAGSCLVWAATPHPWRFQLSLMLPTRFSAEKVCGLGSHFSVRHSISLGGKLLCS